MGTLGNKKNDELVKPFERSKPLGGEETDVWIRKKERQKLFSNPMGLRQLKLLLENYNERISESSISVTIKK